MSLLVLRRLDELWSSQYSSRKVKLRRHFASMSDMVSLINTWLFRYQNFCITLLRMVLRFVRSEWLRTSHTLFIPYERTTHVVRLRYGNVLLTPTVCTLHTTVILRNGMVSSHYFVEQNRFKYICYYTNDWQMLHCALKRSSYWPWYCLNSKQRFHKVCVDK